MKLLRPSMSRNSRLLVFVILALLIINLFFLKLLTGNQKSLSQVKNNQASDLATLESNRSWTFQELADFFTAISRDQGAEYGYQILKDAKLPSDTDLHLLGHVVGDVLYEQESTDGMRLCTQEFRNACSHSIVVGTLLEKGEGSLSEITDACKKAPGGKGAYNMCFHGLGHGVLAYTDYDLEDAIYLCSKTGEQESAECVGGIIMEIISGGDHDKKRWTEQSKKYLSNPDPLFPCTASFIPAIAKNMCFMYLTPHLIARGGGSFANPTKQDIKTAMSFCSKLTLSQKSDRESCFSGFGKELVVLIPNRDIRMIDKMSDEQLIEVHKWCSLAGIVSDQIPCVNSALSSLYWGGENSANASIKFCSLALTQEIKVKCYDSFFNSVNYYSTNLDYKYDVCQNVEDNFKQTCIEKLLPQ